MFDTLTHILILRIDLQLSLHCARCTPYRGLTLSTFSCIHLFVYFVLEWIYCFRLNFIVNKFGFYENQQKKNLIFRRKIRRHKNERAREEAIPHHGVDNVLVR